jgi:glycosyltransferase involved in cell wall biosynthesis
VLLFNPSDDSYGLDRVFLRIVDALTSAGHEVSCVIERDNLGTGWLGEQLASRGIRVTRAPLNNLVRHYASNPVLLLRWSLLVVIRLPAMLRMVRDADIVYVNGFTLVAAAMAGRLSRRRVIWHFHEIPPAGRWLERLARLLSSRQVCVSRAVADAFGLSNRASCSVVHNAVEVPRISVSQPVGSHEAPVEIGIVARINAGKGHLVLAGAFRRLLAEGLAARLHIVGGPHPSDTSIAVALVQELRQLPSDSVVWAGELSSGQAYMRQLHVLAAPSIRPDPFPLSVLEGLAAGLAVVASDTGGHPEAIHPGVTGLLCATGDVGDLAAKLRTLVTDHELRRRLGTAAREDVAQRFSSREFCGQVIAVLG